MKISFCITCMGRLHHLKETLVKNAEDNSDHPAVEFVLLDYNSPDQLERWVKDSFPGFLDGRLSYWRERSAVRWNMPHAKNLAHILATGDIVCNLDADNWTGKGYAKLLDQTFSEKPGKIVTHVHQGGFGGRVALLKKDFMSLRGYDEELSFGWGWEDNDIKTRAESAGLELQKIWMPDDRAIGHDDSERIKFMPEWKDVHQAHGHQIKVFQGRKANTRINAGGFGRGIVYKAFEMVPRLVSDSVPPA